MFTYVLLILTKRQEDNVNLTQFRLIVHVVLHTYDFLYIQVYLH